MQRSRLLRFTVGALMLATGVGFGTSGVGFAALAHGAVTPDTVPAPTDPATIPGYDSDPLSLLGPSRIAPELMAAFVESHGPRTTVPIAELANIYAQEGAALGVRADLAWTQSIIETGFFHFPDSGMVHPQDNNYAGIGACDSCHNGTGYPDARVGVRAQMQLLRGYADPNPPSGMMIYPPKSYRGSAPTWWQMGNGHWATSTRYAESITATYGSLLRSVGIDLAFRPATPIVGDALVNANAMPPVAEVPVREGDGLYLADVHGQVYDTGDARFWGAALLDATGGATVEATTPTARAATAVSRSLDPTTAGVLAIAMTPNANGYWVVSTGGVVNHFGDAPQFGRVPPPTVAIAALPRGYGYWTTDEHGHVRSFGAAPKLEPVAGLIANEARVVSTVRSTEALTA